MKICKYCDTVNPESAEECKGCGAREFFIRCENCGTVFDGFFCPSCGVKVGTAQKTCPVCGTGYYSVSCPQCGYRPGRPENTEPEEEITSFDWCIPAEEDGRADGTNGAPTPKRRHTYLWILGWIFIFPLPLTLLLFRKKSGTLITCLKVALALFAWITYAAIVID